MRDDYGLNIGANGDFIIDKGKICLNTPSKPALQDMVEQIRSTGLRGPILLRFPHLIAKQLDELSHELFSCAENIASIDERMNSIHIEMEQTMAQQESDNKQKKWPLLPGLS